MEGSAPQVERIDFIRKCGFDFLQIFTQHSNSIIQNVSFLMNQFSTKVEKKEI